MQVDILGTTYTINYKTLEEDGELGGLSGYCSYDNKEIVILEGLSENALKTTIK